MLKQDTKTWTIRELMKVSIRLLENKGFEEARLTVELLLAHALRCQRIQLYTNFDRPLTHEEIREFRKILERRLNREPLQYIIGAAGFMGLQFRVDGRVLIPRPETETLVEQVMLLCNNAHKAKPLSILEIGSGSGNVAVSLAKYVKRVHVTGIDVSPDAVEVGELNAKVHEVDDRVAFKLLDVFEPIDQILLRRFDLLVSNPPYVSRDEWEQLELEVRKYEPRTATTDGRDGYVFFRRIFEIAPYVLADSGSVAVEVGHDQAETVMGMMIDAGFFHPYIVPDLQNIPRVVIGFCHSLTRNPGPVN
ncbi:MAG: peptide chain release factor N(5)-glutamine methyltransferase [Ignavibacteriales bacterium]|nr:peptide chain release factor N(5)-glutamine methyltransferase [Ignavibacteriales bacterium]